MLLYRGVRFPRGGFRKIFQLVLGFYGELTSEFESKLDGLTEPQRTWELKTVCWLLRSTNNALKHVKKQAEGGLVKAKRRLSMFKQAFTFITYLLHYGNIADAQLRVDFATESMDSTASNIDGQSQPHSALLLPKWMVRPPVQWEAVVLEAHWDNIVAVLRLDQLSPVTQTFIRSIIRTVVPVHSAPAAVVPVAAAAVAAAAASASAPITDGSAAAVSAVPEVSAAAAAAAAPETAAEAK